MCTDPPFKDTEFSFGFGQLFSKLMISEVARARGTSAECPETLQPIQHDLSKKPLELFSYSYSTDAFNQFIIYSIIISNFLHYNWINEKIPKVNTYAVVRKETLVQK
jgi:hypothetical protein